MERILSHRWCQEPEESDNIIWKSHMSSIPKGKTTVSGSYRETNVLNQEKEACFRRAAAPAEACLVLAHCHKREKGICLNARVWVEPAGTHSALLNATLVSAPVEALVTVSAEQGPNHGYGRGGNITRLWQGTSAGRGKQWKNGVVFTKWHVQVLSLVPTTSGRSLHMLYESDHCAVHLKHTALNVSCS